MAARRPPPRRGAGPLIVLALIALVPALGLFAVNRWATGRTSGGVGDAVPPPDPTAATAPPTNPLTTPLLAWRRMPSLVARQQNLAPYQEAIAAFGQQLNSASCVAVQVGGVEVGSTNAGAAVMPASTNKLLTAHAALHVLGPDFRYTTELRGPAPSGGVISGDVYLVGGGDPLLMSDGYPANLRGENPVVHETSFDTLVAGLQSAGVTQITGDVVGDGSRYDDEYFAPTWADDVHGLEAGPYDALMVNDSGRSNSDQKSDEPVGAAAAELVDLLEAAGITVGGDGSTGPPAAGAEVLATVQSAPMSDVVAEMLLTSDNNTAEMIVKELGVATTGEGSRTAGLAAIMQALADTGVPTENLVLEDGSGLSPDDRLTCAALVHVLDQHSDTDAIGVGLPVAGQSGTLSQIFTGTSVEGRLLGKTGTLCNAPYNAPPPATKGLAGYLTTDAGPVAYALLVSGEGTICDQSVYRPVWDAFVAALDTYPSTPISGDLGPR